MATRPLWIFGYGSLMWHPGFDFAERRRARLAGYARSFCMRSIHHRGTVEDPGLVLALDAHEGSACEGVAFRVEDDKAEAVMTYLRERELISSAYLEATVEIALDDGRTVEAVTYVVDTDHVQYCGGLDLETQAHIIAHAVGGRGPNTEYLYNTTDHLHELDIADEELSWLSRRVRAIAEGGA
ncbi:MAG: gamma-glutamylcyclotransferase [Alphaproteobacteria bacterium]|nr:gamma-glutamylcyclotransferase [Alphaproteobacteria bacterium]